MKMTRFLLSLAFFPFLAGAQDQINLPALAGLTGDAASFGNGEREAYELAIEERNARGGINGKKIVLELQDTASTTNGTLSAYKFLHDVKGHKVILGPTWADTFQGANVAAFRDGTLLISPSVEPRAITNNPGPSLFMVYRPTQAEVETLFQQMKTKGINKLGIITEIEPFFAVVHAIAKEECAKLTIDCASDIQIQQGESEMKSVVTKLSQTKVEGFLLLAAAQDTVLNFLRAHDQLAKAIPVYGIHDFEGYAAQRDFKPYLNNVVFSYPIIEDHSFIERYSKRFGHEPMLTAPNAYDAIQILMDLISEGITDPGKVREALLAREFSSAALGKLRFNKDGSITGGRFEIRYIDGGRIHQ